MPIPAISAVFGKAITRAIGRTVVLGDSSSPDFAPLHPGYMRAGIGIAGHHLFA
jgi:hypothetical protein